MLERMNFENKITQMCFDKYNCLKKTGKPQENEWTVLSAFILQNSADELSVISLCTGTKCLSGAELMDTSIWKRGSRVSDSHAEILARRAFLRYLYNQVNLVLKRTKSEIFTTTEDGQIILIKNTKFHFFSSQTPCGDCSIIPKIEDETTSKPNKIAKLESVDKDFENYEDYSQLDDIYRTGAKCLSTEVRQDTYAAGGKYHVLGPLRTKPGRGDRTLSLSCSDKLAKWILVGLQGSLLSLIIPQIKIESVIIGGGCPFYYKSMERGLYKRFNHNSNIPRIFNSTISFSCLKSKDRNQPCPSSIIWCNIPNRDIEIAVDGRKQGATKKMKKGNYLLICRLALYESFLRILENYERINFRNNRHPKKVTYGHCKQLSESYQKQWNNIKKHILTAWPEKPKELQDFIL